MSPRTDPLYIGGLTIDKQIIGIEKEGEPEKWIRVKTYVLVNCALYRCGNHRKNRSAMTLT